MHSLDKQYCMDTHKKTILFVCGARRSYVRNTLNIKTLQRFFNVIEITSNHSSYFIRLFVVTAKFIFCFKRYNYVFAGFLAQPLIPFIKLRTRKLVIFDAFISLYDTLCFDRKLCSPVSFLGKAAHWLDTKSCTWSKSILTDTKAHADYFAETFSIQRDKIKALYLGADTSLFYPQDPKEKSNKFTVFYYGSGIPLQGIDVILKAAKILEKEANIIFHLVGPIRKKYAALIEILNPQNITFTDWVPYDQLPQEIAKADICLGGHFSDIDKAKRVISGKTYQFIAMKKPVIIGDNEANRELFENNKNALLVKMNNAQALAESIIELKNKREFLKEIAENGYSTLSKQELSCKIDMLTNFAV